METSKHVRKPFEVDAVRVTEENINEVAQWCGGEVRLGVARPGKKAPEGERYIKVPAHRPINEKQTQAYIGDWVLKAETGFKVYTNRAMENSFYQVTEPSLDKNVFNDLEELRTIAVPAEIEEVPTVEPEPVEETMLTPEELLRYTETELEVRFEEPESPTQSNFFGRNQQL